MKEHAAIAIAALMITSMAFAISTTSVSATHATPTISLSPDFVKADTSYVFTLSVTNEGGDPIDTVEIYDSDLTNIEQIVKLPKDNIVEETIVTLSDGTQVTVVAVLVTVAENTVVSLPAGTLIVAPSGDNAELYEDGTAEMIASEEPPNATWVPELQEYGDGTAEWTTEQAHSGSYSVKLTVPAGGVTNAARAAIPNLGAPLTVTTITSVSVQYYLTADSTTASSAYIILELDGDDDGVADDWAVSFQDDGMATGMWHTHTPTYWHIVSQAWPTANHYTLGEVKSMVGSKTILKVKAAVGEWTYTGKTSAYVDDLEIDGEVFDLEKAEEVTVEEQTVMLGENDLRLLEDTLATVSLRLPEDTPAEVPDDVITFVEGDITLVADDTVTLPDDSDNDVRLLANTLILYTSGPTQGIVAPLVAGSEVDLRGSEDVVLPAGTTATGEALVTVAENEDVTIPADTIVDLPTETVPVPMPEDWSFSADVWSSTEDNIAVGETVEFPFAATTPAGSLLSITVKTTDVNDYEALVVVDFTTDGTAPSVTATVSPDPTNSAVTITVEASEELSELGEVTVTQSGAVDENVFTIEMASTDDITWTGTYSVIPDHDGTATVSVEDSTDLVGNVGGANASAATFEVDTIAPDAPRVGTADLNDLPDFTNQPNQLVHGTAIDVAEVLIRVNADVTSVTPRADDGYSVAITLVEGPNEVGVSFADEAGNASEENVQDVFVDSVAPTVKMVSIAGKAHEKDMPIDNNTPTIVARMDDPGYPDTGSGILHGDVSVRLLDENGTQVGSDLDNATPWENSGLWENTYPAELPDGAYMIEVTASDQRGHTTADNFTFVVDTVAPDPPKTPFLSELPTELVDERDHIIRGYAEANSTIKVYAASTLTLIDQGMADSSGYYRFTVTLPEGTHDIYISATDAAGNESDKVLYGTVTVTITPVPPVDTVVPVVSITAPEAEVTTDEASIVIVGKVSELAEWTVSAPSGIWSGTTDSAGNFSASISLVEGTNTIIVTAVDAAGNPSTPVSIEVTRTVVPLETYAIVLVIILLVLAAIAVLKR